MPPSSLPEPASASPPAELTAGASVTGNPSLSTLLRQLADDSRLLVQQEIALAKAEVQTNVLSLAKRTAFIAVGIALLVVGLLVLTAFLVIALGALLGERYWLSSLIVGALLAIAGIGAMLAGRGGLSQQKLAPEQTVASIRESAEWARDEAQRFKQDLTRTNEAS